MTEATAGRIIGRYALYDPLALGGMATVHIGRLLGPVGFARTVAIKRLHPQFARDPEFVSMFLDEARLCARIRHPNVVPTLDVVATQGELFLVMEYIQGESLAQLIKSTREAGQQIPWRVAAAIASGALHGLHAAHEAKDERGTPLGLVHRDVSPQNILVGADGMARVVDFGIAKASGRIHTTREGAVKGKLGYMAYEQMSGGAVTRQSDVYAAAVVLWEALTCRRLFDGETEAIVLAKVLTEEIKPPSSLVPDVPRELDEIVMKGLSRDAADRFATARDMAHALDKLGPAPLGAVGEWVESVAKSTLDERAMKVAKVEEGTGNGLTPVTTDQPAEAAPVATRSGGSIRPTALSEHDSAAPARERSPRSLALAAGVGGVALVVVAVWAIFGRGGTDGSGASAETGAASAARSADSTVLVAAAASSSSAPASSAAAPAVSAEPSVTGSASAAPAPRPSGRLPVAQPSGAKTGSPWSLGGRK
ncbi:MAG: serine/threonine protein kinase [Myxococcales bacterium]|nr:serine/threonine protein kinase [Myxococcales bacterium]